MKTRNVLTAALAGALGIAVLTACEAPPPAAPPVPTTCYVRAQGDNAVLEVTGVDALGSCRKFQQWSLKDNSSRVLEISEAKPDPTTFKLPAFPTKEEQEAKAPTVKPTCSYVLEGTTYAVTDTGSQQIGGGWCKRFYRLSVEEQARVEARR